MTGKLSEAKTLLIAILLVVIGYQHQQLGRAALANQTQQQRIEVNEGWHEDTDAYVKWLHSRIDQQRVSCGYQEIGTPPKRKRHD